MGPAAIDLNELGLADHTVRPLTPADATAVHRVVAAAELADTGEVLVEEADIGADWQRPSFDLATQSLGVLDGPQLVACAEVSQQGRRAEVAVHPDHRGRGIGTALAAWTQRVSRRDGSGLVGQAAAVGSDAERLFQSLGYEPLWTSWVLRLPEGSAIAPQPVPAGYEICTAAHDADRRAAHDVLEDAFLEWSERERETFEDFAAETVHRPGFEPWNVRVLTDPSGDVVGATVVVLAGDCGYVDRIAVRRDERGKGLARALLVDAFEQARDRGATRSELATDSRTGALGLYEKVGMQVALTWRHWAIQTT
jgi:GNAT superfamily N-acetyltransferase